MRFLWRIWAFGGVSGVGWCLDTLVFAVLVHGPDLPAGPANAISAGLAVTFVFLVSHERLFEGRPEQRRRNLAIYAACQVVLVAGAAWLVGTLVDHLQVEPLLVKIAVTPVTFAANFGVLFAITAAGRRVPAAG